MRDRRLSPRYLETMLRRLVAAVILIASAVFVVRAFHLFTFRPEVLGKYVPVRWFLFGHIAGGMAALVTGPFQLWRASRSRYRRAHRVAGRVYVVGVVLAASGALVLASTAAPGVSWAYAISLHVLATVWLGSTLLAWRTAVKRQIVKHEAWATRSYIATVAFVAQALSFELPLVARLGTFAEVAGTVIWLSWTVPMFAYDVRREA